MSRFNLKEIYLLSEGPFDRDIDINDPNGKNTNVVDFARFKRKKESSLGPKKRGFIMSKDGLMLFHPDEFCYVVITDDDQGDALGDGDLKSALDRGAQAYELVPGKEITENDLDNKG